MVLHRPQGRLLLRKFETMKLTEYIKETRGEMKHVNWPTRSQALNYTFLVIGLSVVTSLVLSVADYVFGLGLEKYVFGR
jgi:preprotein translocase SecE subunit